MSCLDLRCLSFSFFEKAKSSVYLVNALVLEQTAFDSSEYLRLLKACIQCGLKGTTQMNHVNQMSDVIRIRGGASPDSIEVVIHRRFNILNSEQLSRDWPAYQRHRRATIIFECGLKLTRIGNECFAKCLLESICISRSVEILK
jgi:hypothetical protein